MLLPLLHPEIILEANIASFQPGVPQERDLSLKKPCQVQLNQLSPADIQNAGLSVKATKTGGSLWPQQELIQHPRELRGFFTQNEPIKFMLHAQPCVQSNKSPIFYILRKQDTLETSFKILITHLFMYLCTCVCVRAHIYT